MKIACLCPTYNRPALLASSLAQFLAQDHPDKKLFIYDDGGQYDSFDSKQVRVIVSKRRCNSLPDKYLTLQEYAEEWQPDAIAMWDDDDIYLPHHLSSIAQRIGCEYQWTAPVVVWSTYTGSPVIEDATGRFWASCAIRWEAFKQIGGVPMTKRGDFDQMFLSKCQRAFGPAVSLASVARDATFVFRWSDTNAPHAQHYLKSPDDCTWYDRMAAKEPLPFVGELVPQLDTNAVKTMEQIRELLSRSI